jgi:6-phosphogluconolactonase
MKYITCKLLICLLPVIGMAQSTKISKPVYMLVGTYTTGTSTGFYLYRFNARTGAATLAGSAATANPSYVCVSPNKKMVYAVNELGRDKGPGTVTAFSFNIRDTSFRNLGSQPTGGDDPCYITTDKTGKWVIAGNYSGGNFSVFPVKKDGSLGASVTTINHEGKGANPQRQEKPHVHCTVFSPNGRYLFVSDLGTDKIMTYTFNTATGAVRAAKKPFTAVQPGAGPRHLVFHPSGRYAYLMEELSGNVTAFSYKDGALKQLQTISALPTGFTGVIGSADIHVSNDGRFLYASNRGESNTIAVYSVNTATGKLTAKDFPSTLGKGPRNFSIDPSGKFLLAANQGSNEIVIFKRNPATGLLTDSGQRIPVSIPVCIKWITAP